MPPAVFELAVPANERLQTRAFDRAATGLGSAALTISFAYFVSPIRILGPMCNQ
jgi:hypothetical protein